MPQIYISKNDVVLGPYELRLVPELVDRGVIDASDYAAYEGQDEWTTVQAILDATGEPKDTSMELNSAPEVKPAESPRISTAALPTPTQHNPVGGTGIVSPALSSMLEKSEQAKGNYLRNKKSGVVTAILNVIYPGLGHLYLRRWVSALGVIVIFTLSCTLFLFDWLWLIPVAAYLVNALNSFYVTKLYNLALAEESGLRTSDEDESVPDYFVPLFIIAMGVLFVFFYFSKNHPELLKPLTDLLSKNISHLFRS